MSVRTYLAEGLGTFLLVVFGSLSYVASGESRISQTLMVSLGFGVGLYVALHAVGNRTAARHLNPAVTWALFLSRQLSAREMAAAWIAQSSGAVLASVVVLALTDPSVVATTATTTRDAGRIFGVELLFSTAFVLVVLGAMRYADSALDSFGAMALAYTGVHLVGLPLGGGSVNPARSIGPAVVSGNLVGLWVFILAPMVGASLAWAIFRMLSRTGEDRQG